MQKSKSLLRIVAVSISLLVLALPVNSLASVNPGLPDFTDLVDEVAPAVVSLTISSQPGSVAPGQQQVPDIFRRFFDTPQPGSRGVDPRLQRPQRPQDQQRFGPLRQSSGSGFIISSDGYIVTNHHVIDNADEIMVKLADNRQFQARVIGSDAMSDIALLKIEANDLPKLSLGNSDRLKRGQWVIAIGSPFSFEQSVTAGIVSAMGRTNGAQQYVPFIQTDVAINRGNSGGPLLNMDGEVVGVNSWILSSGGGYIGLSFSIPMNVVKRTVEQLREHGYVPRGLLGVGIGRVPPELAELLKLDRPRGALINNIEKESAADRFGLEVGDVILEFDGQAIEQFTELPPLIGAKPPNTKISLLVNRWGRQKTLSVELGELATNAVAANNTSSAGNGLSNALGLTVTGLSNLQLERLGGLDGGVGVTKVESESAWRAGIRRGNVILRINQSKVMNLEDFKRQVARVKPGDTVALLLLQEGNPNYVAYKTELKR